MEAHETHEKIHESAHHGHGHSPHVSRNKMIAVMISVLACLLALVEIGVKSSQNTYMASNIQAANLWAFFQAKSIRMTTMRTAAEETTVLATLLGSPDHAAAARQVETWRATAQRYDSEPETGEGRKELAAQAKAAEETRDRALASYHTYEYAAAALQIAIVLSSAATVTGVFALALGAGGLGLAGAALAVTGWLAPHLLHL